MLKAGYHFFYENVEERKLVQFLNFKSEFQDGIGFKIILEPSDAPDAIDQEKDIVNVP